MPQQQQDSAQWSSGSWWNGGSWWSGGSNDWSSWAGGWQSSGGGASDAWRQGGGGGWSSRGGGPPPVEPKLAASLSSVVAEKVGKLNVAFCPNPTASGGRFTPTFETSPSSAFASLNAGDARFMVGGATMNLQFAKDLQAFGGQRPKEYQGLHSRLFMSAIEGRLVAASEEVLGEDPNLCAAHVRVTKTGKEVGVVFIDVFKESCRPHNAKNNVAMVYTVGPARSDCPSDEVFLAEVEAMAANVSAAICEYNMMSALDPPGQSCPLETLRVCLVSGGAFAGGVHKSDVACAIYLGLAEGLCGERPPQFEFAYDGDVFRSVWDEVAKLRAGAA